MFKLWCSSFGSTQGPIYICSAHRNQWDSVNCILNRCPFCLMFMNHEFKKLEQNRIRGACLYLFSLDPLKLFQRWSIYVVLSSFSQVGALLVWYWSLENFISSKHDIQFITFGSSWCFWICLSYFNSTYPFEWWSSSAEDSPNHTEMTSL